MIAYASRTGTKRNLALLRQNGWRLMLSPQGVLRTEGFPYALDNGAWTSHQTGEPFNEVLFADAVSRFGQDADFLVIPDIVCGGLRSLEFSITWMERLRGTCKLLLLSVQDGMVPDDVRGLVSESVGLFVGGSSEWKEETLPMWGEFASSLGIYLHCGRVNSRRRIRLCKACEVNSFDGSGVSRFALHMRVLQPELDQYGFRGW